MKKRDVIKQVLDNKIPPYVPWSFSFTQEAQAKLMEHFGIKDSHQLEKALDNHFVYLSDPVGHYIDLGNDRFRDIFGVIWNRSIDKDIGVVEEIILKKPDIKQFKYSLIHLFRKVMVSELMGQYCSSLPSTSAK